jgi:hypothetical protein
VVRRAVEAYVGAAYDGQQPPTAVRSVLATLNGWGGKFYACPVFVNDGKSPPEKYSLRLGNRHYPHMKLVIERAPDGRSFLFRADTHDRHCCPPSGAPEHGEFCALMGKNQEAAQAVETAWADLGLATFKTWLRDDLARRQSEETR